MCLQTHVPHHHGNATWFACALLLHVGTCMHTLYAQPVLPYDCAGGSRIVFMTEGVLLRIMSGDSALGGFDVIVVDEVCPSVMLLLSSLLGTP